MATVTRKFRDDFDTWAEHQKACGAFTEADIEELKQTLRREFEPGQDTNRAGLSVVMNGAEMPATIDDHEERYRLWAEYFAAKAEAIRHMNKTEIHGQGRTQ